MKNSCDFIVNLVMFAAFQNAIPLRIRQPYEKFNFHINSSDDDYSFIGEKKKVLEKNKRDDCLFFILRLMIFKIDICYSVSDTLEMLIFQTM